MSKCSSSVFTVNGRVGLVEEGITFGRPHSFMMSGACPPPAPFGVVGMNGAAPEGRNGIFHKAAFVQCVGMDHHLNVVIVSDP